MSSSLLAALLAAVVGVCALTSAAAQPAGLPPASGDASCSANAQGMALRALYGGSNGPYWTDNGNWTSTTSPPCHRAGNTSLSLPSHCCYYGIGCCVQAECGIRAADPYVCGCTPGLVTVIELNNNNVSGNFAQLSSLAVMDALACSLRVVSFLNNSWSGSVPAEIVGLSQLQVLIMAYNDLTGSIPNSISQLTGLQDLDLQHNRMTGTVPYYICGDPALPSTLVDVALGGNNFSGPFNISTCESLVLFEAADNVLLGHLPDAAPFYNLHILDLANNSLSGPIGSHIDKLRRLSILNLGYNSFTGTVPPDLNALPYLIQVSVKFNKLVGSLPPSLFELGAVTLLDMSFNQLTGELPDAGAGEESSLTYLDLSSNVLYGSIPASMQQFARKLTYVSLSRNMLSCCGSNFSPNATAAPGYQYIDTSLPRLPPFITFSDVYISVPFDNNSNNAVNNSFIMCRAFLISGQPDVFENLLDWSLDPEYYLYDGCICLPGYVEYWSTPTFPLGNATYSMGPRLQCLPPNDPWYKKEPWALVLIIWLPIQFAAIGLWLAFRPSRGNRPVLQTFINLKKRLAGEPTSGVVSVVTTDIEGYSDMFKQSPELMTKALNIHNRIINKARWTNFGYTLEQEGDSYSLVFYEAIDAVSFCLQTQQALQAATWPAGLFPEAVAADKSNKGKGLPSRILKSINNFGAAISKLSSESSEQRMRALHLAQPANSFLGADAVLTPVNGIVQPTNSASGAELAPDPQINGLRVRMGCATGERANPLKGRSALELAKVVSDAGSGGQVLMDAETFKKIKERLEELGAVDENGYNPGAVYGRTRCRLSFWKDKDKYRQDPLTSDAAVFDMGEYLYCPSTDVPCILDDPVPTTPRPESSPSPPSGSSRFVVPPAPSNGSAAAAGVSSTSAARSTAAAGVRCDPATCEPGKCEASSRHSGGGTAETEFGRHSIGWRARVNSTSSVAADGSQRLRLYQVMTPSLAQRMKAFGNKLALKDDWKCVDSPYFAAPGTLVAPIGAFEGPIELPPVTMVFSTVDGGKTLGRRDARAVHRVIATAIQNTLRSVDGGYSCRMQETDLKYMTAFASAQAALTWSLVMHEVLMYAEWPDSVLRSERCREERDKEGQLIFRGPRLKMGICEGRPKSIIPDHMGRADYHGASVNQAARFMDAGAHGGQVVCEDVLAINFLQAMQRMSNYVKRSTSPNRAANAPERFQRHSPRSLTNPLHSATVLSQATLPLPAAATAGVIAAHGLGRSGPSFDAHTSMGLEAVIEDASEDGEAGDVNIPVFDAAAHPRGSGSGIDGSLHGASSSLALDIMNAAERADGTGGGSSNGGGGPLADGGGSSGAVRLSDIDVEPISPYPPGEIVREYSVISTTDTDHVSSDFARPDSFLSEPASRTPSDVPAVSPSAPAAAVMRKMKLSIVTQGLDDGPVRTRSYTGPVPLSSQATPRPKRRPQLEIKPMRLVAVPAASDDESSACGPMSAVHVVVDDGSPPPPREYHTNVEVLRTGIFQFKGSNDDISMVQVVTTALAGRKYPSDAPKGKGGRVAESSGLVKSGGVILPGIVLVYKEKYEAQCALRAAAEKQQSLAALTSPRPPGGPSPPPKTPRFAVEMMRRVRSGHLATSSMPAGGGGGNGAGSGMHKSRFANMAPRTTYGNPLAVITSGGAEQPRTSPTDIERDSGGRGSGGRDNSGGGGGDVENPASLRASPSKGGGFVQMRPMLTFGFLKSRSLQENDNANAATSRDIRMTLSSHH